MPNPASTAVNLPILIADDDPVSLQLLNRVLEKQGRSVLRGCDGEEALALFREHRPPVVILDWMMPNLDGLDTIRAIRGIDGPTRYTYIILLTAMTGRQNYLKGIDAGADDFLTKPFDPRELEARLTVASRILALQEELKRLEGLLRICSYCKKINDEESGWMPIETYISTHSEASFTHGVCPDCYEKYLRPQLSRAHSKNFPV